MLGDMKETMVRFMAERPDDDNLALINGLMRHAPATTKSSLSMELMDLLTFVDRVKRARENMRKREESVEYSRALKLQKRLDILDERHNVVAGKLFPEGWDSYFFKAELTDEEIMSRLEDYGIKTAGHTPDRPGSGQYYSEPVMLNRSAELVEAHQSWGHK